MFQNAIGIESRKSTTGVVDWMRPYGTTRADIGWRSSPATCARRNSTDSMPLIAARVSAKSTTLIGFSSYLPTSSVGNGRNATNAR